MAGKTNARKIVNAFKAETRTIKLSTTDYAKLKRGSAELASLTALVKQSKQNDIIVAFEVDTSAFTGRVFIAIVDDPNATPPVIFGVFVERSAEEVGAYYEAAQRAD